MLPDMASGVHPVLQSQILCFVIAMQQIGKEDVLHGPNHLWDIMHKAFTLRIRTQQAHLFCNQGWNIHHSPIKHKRVRNLRRGIYWIIELCLESVESKIPKAFHHGLRHILEVPSNRCGSHLVSGSSPLSRSSKSKEVETKPTKGLPVMIEPRGCTRYHERFASGQEKSVVLALAEKCGLLSSVWLVGIVKGADLFSRHCSVFHLLLLRVFMFSHDGRSTICVRCQFGKIFAQILFARTHPTLV